MIAKCIVNYSAPMETWIVLLPALLGIYDRPTDRSTDLPERSRHNEVTLLIHGHTNILQIVHTYYLTFDVCNNNNEKKNEFLFA